MKKQHWIALTSVIVLLIAAASVWWFVIRSDDPVITDFDSCVKASGQVMESYPEQCVWQGKTYVNTAHADAQTTDASTADNPTDNPTTGDTASTWLLYSSVNNTYSVRGQP